MQTNWKDQNIWQVGSSQMQKQKKLSLDISLCYFTTEKKTALSWFDSDMWWKYGSFMTRGKHLSNGLTTVRAWKHLPRPMLPWKKIMCMVAGCKYCPLQSFSIRTAEQSGELLSWIEANALGALQ